MPITPYMQRTQSHRIDTCNDQVVGAILSGWRYDISSVPKDLRGDYEAHLNSCAHCRRRQHVHRTWDFLLLAAFTLTLASCLLMALVMHKIEAYSHIQNVHLHLHAAAESNATLARIPSSITLSLEFLAILGVVVSSILWLLVALATPAPTMLFAMFRARRAHGNEELDKQAA